MYKRQSLIEVEILQTPYSAYAGYDAPSASQNPADYRDGLIQKSGVVDISADRDRSTYEPKNATGDLASGGAPVVDTAAMTTQAYVESLSLIHI